MGKDMLAAIHRAQSVAPQAISDALRDSGAEDDPPIYEWEHSAAEIAISIAGQFFPVTSIFNADLKRKIERAIENERCIMERHIRGE